MAKNEMEEIIQRTQRYWCVDGLAEIGFGIFMLLVTLFLLLNILIPHDPTSIFLFLLGYLVIAGLGGFGLNSIYRQLKERITYPRTGYVAYRRPSTIAYPNRHASRLVGTILLLVFIFTLVTSLIGVLQNSLSIGANLTLFGIIMALPLYLLGGAYGVWRFYLLGALIAVLGLVVGRIAFSESIGMLSILGGVGLLTIISGGFTLLNYKRTTRSLDDPSPGE